MRLPTGSLVDGVPDGPDEPTNPNPTPGYPSKEYDGKDITLNQNLPTDVDFPQLHVSTKDGKSVVEITGVSVDLMDDTTFWKEPSRYEEAYWSRWTDVWVHGDWAKRDEND